MGDLSKKSKSELLEIIEGMKKSSGKGRSERVLELLRSGYDSIGAISEEMGIKSKNVSSILSGLRKKGFMIVSYKVGGNNIVCLVEGDSLVIKGGNDNEL